MNQPALTRELVREWLEKTLARLLKSIEQLDSDQAQTTLVTAEWTVADTLGHVLAWEEVAVRALQDWTGDRSWLPASATSDGEAFNQQMAAEKKNTPLPILIERILSAQQTFLATLENSSDEELATIAQAPWGPEMSLLQMIAGIAGHTAEHAHEIEGRN